MNIYVVAIDPDTVFVNPFTSVCNTCQRVVTNLDSILKSRDITLPTKVRIVKALVLVVMYRCESWPIKKVER